MGFGVGFAILGAVSIGAAFLMRPKGQHIKTEGPRLDELQSTTSQYGIGIPRVWGAYTVPGNVIWVGHVREHKKTTTSRSGGGKGGGGSSKQTHTDYSYTVSVAVGLASAEHRPIKRVLRILMDNKVVYDVTGGSIDQTVRGLYWRFYDGSENQQPDSIIAAKEGLENTPAFRGLSYIVFDELPITSFGNRIPQMRILVESDGGDSYCLTKQLPVTATFGTSPPPTNFTTGKAYLTGTPSSGERTLFEIDIHRQTVTRERRLRGDRRYSQTAIGFGQGGTMVLGARTATLYNRTRLELWDANALRRKRTYGISTNYSGGGTQIVVGEYVGAFDGTHRTIACIAHGPMNIGSSMQRSADVVDVENSRSIQLGARGFYRSLNSVRETTRIDYRYIHSYFAHKGDYSTSTEFYWLHADVSVDEFTGDVEHFSGSRMLLYLAEVKDYLKIRKVLGVTTGFTIRPELNRKRIRSISLSDIDPSGDVTHFYATAGGFLDTLGQNNCIVDGIVPTVDGGLLVFACRQTFTIKLNSSGAIVWRFKSDPDFKFSKAWASDSFGRTVVTGYRAGGTVAVRGRLDGRLGIYTLDVMTGKPLDFCGADGSIATNYDAATESFMTSTHIVYLQNFDSGLAQVATIVDDLSSEVGLQDSAVGGLSGLTVTGYLQSKPASPKDMITPLANIFSFDCVESDGRLRWFTRGAGSVASYTPDDMVKLRPHDEGVFECSRIEDVALPQAVSVTYAEEETSHERNTVSRQRFTGNEGYETMRSRNKLNLEAPVAITVGQAKHAADVILMSLWNGRTSYKLRLPRPDVRIEVGDVITIEVEGQFPDDVYVERVSIGADLQVEIEGVSQDTSQYTSLVEGSLSDGFIPPVLEHPKYTRLYMLPIPHLMDESDTQGLTLTTYYAMGAYEDGWRSGVLEQLTSGGGFEEVSLQPTSAAHGLLVDDVPIATKWDVHATNWDTHIDVAMLHGELETASYADVMDGANAVAVIYSTNEAEIIQFNRAELLDDDTYRLTGIIRGQRGTDWLALSKPAPEGAEVVFLSDGHVGAFNLSLDRLDDVGIFKGYNLTQEPEDGDTRGLVLAGYEMKPWAPTHLTAEVVGGGDIEVMWVRRTRIQGGLHDGTDEVPIGEADELYEVDVLVGSEVVRTLTSDVQAVTYTVEQRIEDGTDELVGSIEFHVYQMSAAVGRGYRGVVSTKGIDLHVAQHSASAMYVVGRPDYEVGQQTATVLQSLTVELRAAQQSMVVLHEHPYLPDIQVAQQSTLAMHKPIHGDAQVAQSTKIILHEVEI